MESRSKQIDESPDELLQLVRHHVEDVLHEYYQKNGVKTDYDIRDDAVLYVYELARKKVVMILSFKNEKGNTLESWLKTIYLKIIWKIQNNFVPLCNVTIFSGYIRELFR